MQAPISSHLDYCHRLLNGTRDGHLVTLTSSQLPEFHQMSAPAPNLPGAPCCLLTTLDEVQAPCLRESPRSAPRPLSNLFSYITLWQHLLLMAAHRSRLLCPGALPSTLPTPKAQSGRPSSRKHPLALLCATRKQNIYTAVPSARCNHLFASGSPRPTGLEALQGGDHIVLVFESAGAQNLTALYSLMCAEPN